MKVAFIALEEEQLGVEYLSAMLKKYGHEVRLFFDPLLFSGSFFKMKFLARLFSFKSRILSRIEEFNPGLICFSVLSDYYKYIIEFAKEIKKRKNIPIVFGGIHATSVPEEVIKKEYVDFLIVGEGECALADLASALENNKDVSKIPNVWSKKNGTIIKNNPRQLVEDLDDLPFPDKHLYYDVAPYLKVMYLTISSRGCPFMCTYCNNNLMKKIYPASNYLRRRSVNNVIKELKIAKERYRPKRVIFHDEVFTMDQNWLEEFAGKYKEEVDIPYFCWVHPGTINEKTVRLLKESGCAHVQMGVQTFSEKTREDVLHRHYSNKQVERAIRLLKNAKIFITTDNIIGLPGQSKEELLELARFYSRNKVNLVYIYWLRYYPKTEIVDIALKKGILNNSKVTELNKMSGDGSFLISGSTFNKELNKIRAFILLGLSLPPRLVGWLISKNAYRFVPNFRFLNPFLINHIFNKLIGGAFRRMKVYPIATGVKKYLRFMKEKLLTRG